jgi:Glycosyl transferase family 2
MAGPHVLTIVIPALNEEEAIGSTLQRTLDARAYITQHSPVRDVDIVVVSDGSSDRTEEIAKSFEDVTVLVFEKNRGYGAAIKCGFEHGRGDLVSFLDADGTCDPKIFADLCRALDEQRADLVLGSRMGKDSEMPLVRTIGNRIFAWILGALSKRLVKDTASGMRVIRREALEHLYPLPDGLHFTPAMSARALLEDKLQLVEVPMPYSERVGRSKLSVVKDGVRFLTVIVRAAVAHRPSRPLLLAAGVLVLATLAVAFQPVAYWLAQGELREPMIYRVMLASLLGTLSAIVVCSAVVSERVAALVHRRAIASRGVTGRLERLLSRGTRRWSIAALAVAAFASSWPGMVQYLSTGQVDMHWSRAMLSSMLVVVAAMLVITSFLIHMLELVAAQLHDPRAGRPPDRIRPARSTPRAPVPA